MEIILIRHGETDDNVRDKVAADGSVLNETGKQQILHTKKLLPAFSYEEAYASPLERAMQSAALLGLDPVQDARLREVDYGVFKGYLKTEVMEKYPEKVQYWQENLYTYDFEYGESYEQAAKRVYEFLDEVSRRDRSVLCVTHNNIVQAAVTWVLGSMKPYFQVQVDNGSISVLEVKNGYRSIKLLNGRPEWLAAVQTEE